MSQLNHAAWDHELDALEANVALRAKFLDDYTPLPTSQQADLDPHLLHNCREYLRAENQRNMGSCQGQALTTAIEHLIWKATGQVQHLSRMFAYIRSQLKDGIRGDRGSSLTAGVAIAKSVGIPLERYWPYPVPARYTQRIPDVANERAADIKLIESVRLNTYEKIVSWLREGDTTCYAGMGWGGTLSSAGERITKVRISGSGGHAIAFPQLSPETIDAEESDIDLFNSHGTRWGKGGVSRVHPDVIREMLDSRLTRMMGGFIGLRGVQINSNDIVDAFDRGNGETMVA